MIVKQRHILAAAAVVAAIACATIAAARVDGVILDRAAQVQGFTLEDHSGKPFTADSLKGHR